MPGNRKEPTVSGKPRSDATRVLVVDDEQDIRDGSQRILARAGFSVLTADRGDAALKILESDAVSIVLLDLKMPGIDGMEVLDRIRKQPTPPLVIVITGFATVETAIEAMKHGAYDFIPKPFDPEQLRIVVNRAEEKLRLEREKASLEAERRRTLTDLGTEKSRLRTIVESLPNGVLVTNADASVVLMNPAFRQLVGLSFENGIGKPIEDCIPDAGLCRLVREISTGRHVDFEDIPTVEFELENGNFLLARGQPVLGDHRECLGAVVNVVDITGLKSLDRLKSEFVAKVSHELRSPLATIHEQLAHVLNDMVGEAFKNDKHMLGRAKEKTQGLIHLIGDLLDLSRIEEGEICHEPKPIELASLLEEIVRFLKDRAEAKKQTLELSIDGAVPAVTADPIGLESIFGNLISNAINYTPEGGKIQVLADVSGIYARVRVVDNGFGIEARHLEKIFDRFYRVKDDNTRYITGTGLGLPIVKGLVESIGGIVNVESAPGEGSTFEVRLPVDLENPPPAME
ncbi:MAG: response regulator [Desulfobacterales bacterium]|nr:response regulator [Desulfobacterales bacterium]MCF8078685.1 response regulator [Desulfobacterales bacterium]